MSAAHLFEQPLPPNAVLKHSKVSLVIRPKKALYVAGDCVEGILELSCTSDKVWLGRIAVEFRGDEQLQSLDHVALRTFIQADVAFQSSSLPPSNAVLPTSPSTSGYWPARKGITRFPFSFPLPSDSPSSCIFGRNASCSYTLSGEAAILYQGERQALVKRLEIPVVERWDDLKERHFHERSESQSRGTVTSGLVGGREGTVWAEATIPDPFFFRGWETQGGQIEMVRARGRIPIRLSVRNMASRSIDGVKVALLRRLKVSAQGKGYSGPLVAGPRMTETCEETVLTGSEWGFPAGGDERMVTCWIHVARQDKFLTIRKTRLFELRTLVRVTLELGPLSKAIVLELPVWVAHYASLPPEAFVSPSVRLPVPLHQTIDRGHTKGQRVLAGPTIFDAQAALHSATPHGIFQQPILRSQSAEPYQQHHFKHPAEPVQGGIPFNPYAPSLTPSNILTQWPDVKPPLDSLNHVDPSRSNSSMAFSAPTVQPSFAQYYNQPPQGSGPNACQPHRYTQMPRDSSPTYIHAPMRSSSAQSAPTLGSYRTPPLPPTQRTLSPDVAARLTNSEQVRVLENSEPTFYDAAERAHTLRLQQQGILPVHGTRHRRRSMPTLPGATLERRKSLGKDPAMTTPPPAPSSVSRMTTPEMDPMVPMVDGLATIGEEGESRAGTMRFNTLLQKTPFEHTSSSARSPGGSSIINSVKALRVASVDEEGNTSASLLEDLVDAQDKLKEQERGSADISVGAGVVTVPATSTSIAVDKTLPRPPVPSGKEEKAVKTYAKPGVFEIFAGLTQDTSAFSRPNVSASGETPPELPRYDIGPHAARHTKLDANHRSFRADPRNTSAASLAALESRLSRPTSPETRQSTSTSAKSPLPSCAAPSNANRSSARSRSPLLRTVSPVHVGNEGALRKKSSQMWKKGAADRPVVFDETAVSKTAVVAPTAGPVSARPLLTERSFEDSSIAQSKASDLAGSPSNVTGTTNSRSPLSKEPGPAEEGTARRTGRKINNSHATTSLSKTREHVDASECTGLADKASVKVACQPARQEPVKGRAQSDGDQPKEQRGSQTPVTQAQDSAVVERSHRDQAAPSYEVKSARGGKGGLVTNVAKQWAELVAAAAEGGGGAWSSSSAHSDRTLLPKPRATKVTKEHGVQTLHHLMTAGDVVPPNEERSRGDAALSHARSPQATSSPRTPTSQSDRRLAHNLRSPKKGALAMPSTNTTMGKTAVFVRSRPRPGMTATATRMSSSSHPAARPETHGPHQHGRTAKGAALGSGTGPNDSRSAKEQAFGPGATKLRELIERFS